MTASEGSGDPGTQLSVRDLLALPSLGLRLLAAPDRVDARVRWAHPTELIDPRPYLQGGELVLTVGTSLTSEAQCRDFVSHVVEAGVSAVGFGVGDVVDETPEALVDACRQQDVPLLRVPHGVPFQTIAELVVERRAEARNARSRRLQVLAGRVLEAIAEDRPMADLLAIISGELGGALEYAEGRLAWSPTSDADVRPGDEGLRHLARILAVRQHEEDREHTSRRREIGRLVELVLQGRADVEVLHAPLESAGVALDQLVVPAVWPGRAGDLVAPLLGPGLVADVGEHTVTVSTDAGVVQEASRHLALPCGLGEAVPVGQLAQAIPPALAALNLSRDRGELVTYRDLTTFEGLLELQPPQRLAPFAEALVQPLVEHDEGHGSALLQTLRTFLDNDGSVTATAQAMFLHPNSLRHRLKRIEELTGANPRSFRDRVGLAIGLWSWERGLRRRR